MRIRITRAISGSIDGIQLDGFAPGSIHDVGTSLGSYLLAERAAEPVADELSPIPPEGHRVIPPARPQGLQRTVEVPRTQAAERAKPKPRRRKSRSSKIGALALMLVWAAPIIAQDQPRSRPAPPTAPARDYVIGSQDVLIITSYDEPALSQNVALQGGDTIFVLRAENIFVFGQVKNPGAYPMQPNTTVLQALSLAGGVTARGSTTRLQIVRIADGEKQELRARLTDFVQAGDTIVVPERFF